MKKPHPAYRSYLLTDDGRYIELKTRTLVSEASYYPYLEGALDDFCSQDAAVSKILIYAGRTLLRVGHITTKYITRGDSFRFTVSIFNRWQGCGRTSIQLRDNAEVQRLVR